jgi:hypothetical protein
MNCPHETWPYLHLGCRDESTNNRRRIRLVSTDRMETSITTIMAPVELPIVTANNASGIDTTAIGTNAIHTVEIKAASRRATVAEDISLASPSAPKEFVPRADQRSKDVPATARADARRSAHSATAIGKYRRDTARQTAPALAAAPRAYSFTGAGQSFDAVH